MELITFFPSISIGLICQKYHIPYMRSLWAVLEVASRTTSSQEVIAANFVNLPQALELLRQRWCELMTDSQPVSQLAELIWDETEKRTISDFCELPPLCLPVESGPARESLHLTVSVQNAGLLSALWSILESNSTEHLVNLEIASLPKAVLAIQTTLDQLLLPAINQVSCLDPIVPKGLGIQVVDLWTADQKEFVSSLIGWDLPALAYSSPFRLN